MKSEVAQLRQRIEEEITSMRLLMNGSAVVSRHALITHKYRDLGMYQQELAQFVLDSTGNVERNGKRRKQCKSYRQRRKPDATSGKASYPQGRSALCHD